MARSAQRFTVICLFLGLAMTAGCDSDSDDPATVTCDGVCATGQVCAADGTCVDTTVSCDPACAADQVCAADGSCVDPAVTCDPACVADQVCTADGTCADTAVSCDPACGADEVCSADGACVALGVTCDPACGAGDACAADGSCVTLAVTCDPACGAGEACSSDGTCVTLVKACSPACAANQVCSVDGACVDVFVPCDPACLENEVCLAGACYPATDHTTFTQLAGPFATGPEVTAACLSCHTDEAMDVMSSAHYQWLGPTPGMEGHETGAAVGKRNTINNFCIAVVSNEARCTQCHAGYGWKDDMYDFDDPTRVDCLVCHDGTGQYKKDKKTAGAVADGVDLVAAARSVGPPSNSNCGSCHFFAGGGDNVKKGDIGSWAAAPAAAADVHMGADDPMSCASCHAGDDHRMLGGGLHNPVEEEPLSCTDCHQGPVIHTDMAVLDQHTAHIACETCHIPAFSRQQATKLDWKWSFAGDMDRVPVMDANGKPDYDKMKGEFVWGKNVKPTLAWYNGSFTRMLVGDDYTSVPVDLGSPMGDITDPDARIAPFKVMTGDQPADTVNKVLAVPHLFGMIGGPNPYWAVWDWQLAIAEGMAAAGLTYSGTYGFVETSLHMELHHEIAPKAQALDCLDCHQGGIDFTALGYTGDPMTVGGQHATQ